MKIFWEVKKFEELSLQQLYAVLKLRIAVFVVEQNCAFQDIDGRDAEALHLLAFTENRELVAYSRLFDKGVYFQNFQAIGRVLTHENYRNQGLGKELMIESIQACERNFGSGSIKIGAQKQLTHFYQLFRFEEVGEDYLEDGIPHTIMIRKKHN